jgi:isopropylmalate/homocitrate/citramalate synthase
MAHATVGIDRVVLLHAFDPDRHDAVLFAASNLARGGFTQVVLDDTAADANPLIVRQRLVDVSVRIKPSVTGVCLRDHAGLGLANALAALKSGVTQFDTALGGMGGLIATEDVLYLMELLNISAGASRGATVNVARSLVGNPDIAGAIEPRPTWTL